MNKPTTIRIHAAQFADEAGHDAARLIEAGHDPESLVHILTANDGRVYVGLSSPLPPTADLTGYISRYYTLAELAGWYVETEDKIEHRVSDADTIDGVERFGVGVLVEWAVERGIARDGNRVRAIITPAGERITQF